MQRVRERKNNTLLMKFVTEAIEGLSRRLTHLQKFAQDIPENSLIQKGFVRKSFEDLRCA